MGWDGGEFGRRFDCPRTAFGVELLLGWDGSARASCTSGVGTHDTGGLAAGQRKEIPGAGHIGSLDPTSPV